MIYEKCSRKGRSSCNSLTFSNSGVSVIAPVNLLEQPCSEGTIIRKGWSSNEKYPQYKNEIFY